MSELPMPGSSSSRAFLTWIALGLVVLYGAGILGHDLWTPDEPRVAAVARQVAEGAWAVPTLNGEPFLEQPPLHYWFVALIYLGLGYDPPELARLASAFCGLVGLALTFLFAFHLARAGRSRDEALRIGALAALALGLSGDYFNTAHRVVVDNSLFLFTTLSALALYRGLQAPATRARLLWLALGYLAATAAFLAKGVIGLAIPGLAFLALVVVRRDARLLVRGHLWLAPLCFAVVAGPWFYFLHRHTGSEGFADLFVANTLGRILPGSFGRDSTSHTNPVYYYLIYLPLHMMPATLFFLGAVVRRFRERSAMDATERFALDFVLLWFAAGFVMLSLASTKRALYLVPLYPAAAMAGGFWLDAYLRSALSGWYARTVGYVLSLALILIALALPAAAGVLAGGLDATTVAAGIAALVVLAVGWMVWRANTRGDRTRVLLSTLLGLGLAVVAGSAFVVPGIDARKSLGPPARRLVAAVPATRPLHVFHPDETTLGMIPFYTGRPLVPVADVARLEALLRSDGVVYLMVVAKRRHSDGSPKWNGHLMAALPRLDHELVHDDPGQGRGSRRFRVYRFTASRMPAAPSR